MTFGIPAEQLPVTNTGTIKTKHHAQWMRLVQAKEKAERNGEAFDCIECPEINDVLFTLGRQTWCHPGYAMFRGLLETNFPRHNAADTMKAKRDITWEVVEEVEKKGGRFLMRDLNGWWIKIKDRSFIRAKVASAFRNHSKRVVVKPKCQEESQVAVLEERESKRFKPDNNCCVDFAENGWAL